MSMRSQKCVFIFRGIKLEKTRSRERKVSHYNYDEYNNQ